MIVFRASDIIELKIINASPVVDPAILSSSSTPSRPGSGGSNDATGNKAGPGTKAAISNPTEKDKPMISTMPTMTKISHFSAESTKASNVTTQASNKSSVSPSIERKEKPIGKTATVVPLSTEESNQKLLSTSTSSVTIIDPAPLSKASELKPARTYEPIGQKTEGNDIRPFSSSTGTSNRPPMQHAKPHPVTTPKVHENKRVPRERKAGFPREFDMDRANRRFENILAKDGLPEPQMQSTCYDSNASFFDSLTSTDLSSTGGSANKSSARKDIRLNVETFGTVAYSTKPSYYQKTPSKGHKNTRKYPGKGSGTGSQPQFRLSSSSSA